MSHLDRIIKRTFDLFAALAGLLTLWWLILLLILLASIDTRQFGLFRQERIGLYGKPFNLLKIRTMRPDDKTCTNVTRTSDPRITTLGAWLRRFKLDELPQLWNVLIGEMSMVGPRPDVIDMLPQLIGSPTLTVRPGITGPASLKYRDEEEILEGVSDPELYNQDVIFPDKIRINDEYIKSWSLPNDIRLIWQTIFS